MINRWGVNQLWHHCWLSPKNFTKTFYQNKLFVKLTQTYLKYGLSSCQTVNFKTYWLNTRKSNFNSSRYYRRAIFENKLTNELVNYRFRLASKKIYLATTTLLRYDSWFILFIQWYNPSYNLFLSKKNKNKNDSKYVYYLTNPKSVIRLSYFLNSTVKSSTSSIYCF